MPHFRKGVMVQLSSMGVTIYLFHISLKKPSTIRSQHVYYSPSKVILKTTHSNKSAVQKKLTNKNERATLN